MKKITCIGESETFAPELVSAACSELLVSTAAVVSQIRICVRPTAPTPRILPASICSDVIVASSTSKTREDFSSMIDRATFMP